MHLLAFCIVTSPLVLFSHYTSILAFFCILVTWLLLMHEFPLISCIFFITALNLDLTLSMPLVPVFLVQAVGSIIVNSPSALIVKQVDYIVWKVIFLLINFTLVNAIIWWPYITSTTTTSIVDNNDEPSQLPPKEKLSFDFRPAKQIIGDHLLNYKQVYTRFSIPLGAQLGFVFLSSIPVLYYQVKETSDARQLIRASVICSGAAYLVGLKGDNSGVNLAAAIAFSVLLAPEMTPFATSLALLFNLTQYQS